MPLIYPAGQSPYLSLKALVSAPTGISWSTIPPNKNATDADRQAAQIDILTRATARCDGYVNQVLRATLDTEQLTGPDFRITVQVGSGNGRIILARWPILQIVSVQVSPNRAFPRQWTTIPVGQWDIEVPPIPLLNSVSPAASADGGQAILIPPGYVNWCYGRNGWVVRIQYVNGWPHASLIAQAQAQATTIDVDDCTGWAITGEFGQVGAAGILYDFGAQETVQVTKASATSGTGTLTLASPLQYEHDAGCMVTTMPQQVPDAMILFSAAEALMRGATSTTIHQLPGGAGGTSGGGSPKPTDYIKMGECLLAPFRRTI